MHNGSTVFIARNGERVLAAMGEHDPEAYVINHNASKCHHCGEPDKLDEHGLCFTYCSGVVEVSP